MPRKAKDAGEVKLVRRLADGKVEARARGRAPAGAVNGYLDEAGNFIEGNPRKKRRGKRGRPKGSANKATVTKVGRPKSSVRKSAGGLSEIEQIVQREVSLRLKTASAAAIKAITAVLA